MLNVYFFEVKTLKTSFLQFTPLPVSTVSTFEHRRPAKLATAQVVQCARQHAACAAFDS